MLVAVGMIFHYFFFPSRSRHTRYWRDWSSDVCSSDLGGRHGERAHAAAVGGLPARRHAAGLGDRVAHRTLQRMARAEVAVERPALGQAAGQPERVLAR